MSRVSDGEDINDHGLVECLLSTRIQAARKAPRRLDYSALMNNAELRTKFDEKVCAELSADPFNSDDPSISLEHLQKSVLAAAKATLPEKKLQPLRKRQVSMRTRELYEKRQFRFNQLSLNERKAATRAIANSCRQDYREYIDSIITDMENAIKSGNTRKLNRLIKQLSKKSNPSPIMPAKDLSGNTILSTDQLLSAWNEFLTKKFQIPDIDLDKQYEHTVSPEDHLSTEELEECLKSMNTGRAPGWDEIPIEAYQNSISAKTELFRLVKLIWDSEVVPPNLVKGIFIMLYKKKDRNNFGNYRAICLLIHAYKLLSAVIVRRLHMELEEVLPDSQAGFRQARGTRDNICILKWTIKMILREQRRAVVTFIDYTAAFDSESYLFLDEALRCAGISIKVRRIIRCIFKAASGCVRLRKPDGSTRLSDLFDICRGVLQVDIFSAVCFIVGLWRVFILHDIPHAGVRVGRPPYQVDISKLEYTDDASLIDDETKQSSERITSISVGSRSDAAMEVSIPKTNAMHIHPKRRVSCTTEDEVKALQLKHICPDCGREFTTKRGLSHTPCTLV